MLFSRGRYVVTFKLLLISLLLAMLAMLGSVWQDVEASPGLTFTVNSSADPGDGTCDDTECTLREAIAAANASAGTDSIEFSIASGAQTILPASALPTINDPVTIDGQTQPGFTGSPVIELNGTGAGPGANGLTVTAGSSTIKGLVINRFSGCGIELATNGGNTIEGNYIGTNLNGMLDRGNALDGVYLNGAPANAIGGANAGARNVISGNDRNGVYISGTSASQNQVQGNYIGTDVNGILNRGNTSIGVRISDAPDNTIGGTAAGARNVISGNAYGVYISGTSASQNQVQGNFIGTDVNGTADLGNSYGVLIGDASRNTIGGTTAGAGNVISGSVQSGVYISGTSASQNQVQGNYIGTDVSGTSALGNSSHGVSINAPGNTIGGTAAGARNVISGNGGYGIYLWGVEASQNQVQGNYIGTDAYGTVDIGNYLYGVGVLEGPCDNLIGGTVPGARNLISGNGVGVWIAGNYFVNSTDNRVQGNYIGTDVTGTAALGNSSAGVLISLASQNTVGGTISGAGNVISGNLVGVRITQDATANSVEGNYIGTDINGAAPLGNSSYGVYIDAPGNTVGGTTTGARNIISGNQGHGIVIAGSEATENLVQGNYIGTRVDGTTALRNDLHGIYIVDSASANTVGGTGSGDGNRIAFNEGDGVRVDGAATIGNGIRNNSIHSNGGKAIENINGGNMELAPPVIDAVGSASGHTAPKCYPCTVEIFSDDEDEGRLHRGSAATNGDATGTWTYAGAVAGPNITATVTDTIGNTSEFSAPMPSPPVGGIAEYPQLEPGTTSSARGSTGPNPFAVSGIIAGSAILLAAGGWYARRRWLR